ncbi:response regulator [Gemmatimonas sp.]|uniref:response regulator n=1 Tax=Gemmatimonas sp. TaxID=1962908 RepID=UPI00286E4E1C|nr:response regulator [Gemmatimonas sp.]
MTPATILVIEDETPIRSVIRAAAESEGYVVYEAATAAHGLSLAQQERPSLIVLDLGLPDADGLVVCQSIRAWSSTPIIVLSARHTDREMARLLDAGADDFLAKPFSTLELQARLRAHLRRARMPSITRDDAPIRVGRLTVDRATRTLTKDDTVVHLTPTEWALLLAFVTHAGRTMTHQQLFDAVWGRSHGDAQQYLRVYVAHLRRKIEDDSLRPTLIITESAVGYRFAAID